MIVLDTTILVYAVGADHPLRDPCRKVVDAVANGRVDASTTAEVIQEFVHIRARRRGRRDATMQGRDFLTLFRPLLGVDEGDLELGLRLFVRHSSLGAIDSVLAAIAVSRSAEALVSADRAFATVKGLVHVHPESSALDGLLG